MSPDALYERTVQALQASRLQVEERNAGQRLVTAAGRLEERAWAECNQPMRLVEGETRNYLVEVPVDDLRVELTAQVRDEPDGAVLNLESEFLAQPGGPMATTEECRTTGALERRIFNAVGA